MDKVWLKGEYEFASLFSYRVPNFSPAYAPSSPLPGPSTLKLALVVTRIETTGRVSEGAALFEGVKRADVGLEPPSWVAISRVFQRRLKRMKYGGIGPSFGIREYVHYGGPIGLYVQVDENFAALVADTMRRLRRIGTSDSLLCCLNVGEVEPDLSLIARPVEAFMKNLDPELFVGRPVLPLRDIKDQAKFSDVDVYNKGGGDFTRQRTYIFPLHLEQQGQGWTWYRRAPFHL